MSNEIGENPPDDASPREPKRRLIIPGGRFIPRRLLHGGREEPTREQGPYDYQSAVQRYLAQHAELVPLSRLSPVAHADIPTVHGYVPYSERRNALFVTDRSETEYDGDLFSDEYRRIFNNRTGRFIGIPLDTPSPPPLAGGKEAALAGRRVVVDLGSGEAVALLQYAQKFRDATFIGIDRKYGNSPDQVDLTIPGVQLLQDDWNVLEKLPPQCAHTIFSACGALQWGVMNVDPRNEEDQWKVIRAITRIAAPEAILRSIALQSEPEREANRKIETMLRQEGWTVQYATNTLVAVK